MTVVTRLAGAALAAAILAACGGPPLCVRSTDCEAPAVCGLAGRCAPLAPPAGARFAGSRWLHAVDWGVAGAGGPLTDRLPVGGEPALEALLAFGPLPARGHVLRALLVLAPHEAAHRVGAPTELVVEHAEPFRGGALPPRRATVPARFAAGRRLLPEGPARPLRVDVTEAARSAADRDDRRLYLLVRAAGGGPLPLAFGSPDHTEADRHPRLELMLH